MYSCFDEKSFTLRQPPVSMKKLVHLSFFIILLAQLSCNSVFQSQNVKYLDYRIQSRNQSDSALLTIMKPYADRVNKSMNEVVGFAETTLEKKQPESTLGNFMADALLIMASEKYSMNVDAAFVNYGGVRLTQLPSGPVTKGKIFELMPFDNLLVLQKIKGDSLQKFLDLTAERGGWPMAGLKMEIKDKKAMKVIIAGKPLDFSATYTIANSDFIANGGDNTDMLRSVPQISNGYLMRDALFDYIKKLKQQGKNISANEENRITNAR